MIYGCNPKSLLLSPLHLSPLSQYSRWKQTPEYGFNIQVVTVGGSGNTTSPEPLPHVTVITLCLLYDPSTVTIIQALFSVNYTLS